MIIAWQAGSQAPENAKNLSIMSNWWKSLDKKSVLWKQRLLPEKGEIDWNPQRFDDAFVATQPEVRGITFYWKKSEADQEANLTPARLEFNPTQQRLYLYPETQEKLVISVEIPGAIRETLQMKNPAWFSEKFADAGGNATGYRLVIHDTTNLVEVQIEMDAGSLHYLKNAVNEL